MGNLQVSPRPSLGGYGLAAGCKLISTACEETLVCWQPVERRIGSVRHVVAHSISRLCGPGWPWGFSHLGVCQPRGLAWREAIEEARRQPRDDELGWTRRRRARTDGKEERDQWVRQDPRSWRWHRILVGGGFVCDGRGHFVAQVAS